jgi:hypothetical protein
MDRNELHELVMLLKAGISSGEIKIPKQSLVHASLEDVRFDADGKVDPSTVNSTVRATALAAIAAKNVREMRKIPLREVQAQYFEILDQFFGHAFSEMKAHAVTPADIAADMASHDRTVRAFEGEMHEFAAGMREFWGHYAPVVELHLGDLKGLKSVFGGDVFPSYTANIACSVGLYVDTIILPDPLLRILSLAKMMRAREAFRMVAKHALSALGYRELALADVNPPIVVVVPDPMFFEGQYERALQVTSERDVVKHASIVFGRKFSTMEELHAFLGKFSTVDGLIAKLADPKRFLFDSEWSEPLPEQFARYVQEAESHMPGAVGPSVGETAYGQFFGRMMQTNDLLFRSARYTGTPLIDAPTSWQYLLWKYEYDAERSGTSQEMRQAVISKVIASEGSTEFGMLSGVPPDSLIELRRNGAMASLRETLRGGLSEMDLASPDLLSKVADEVIGTIDHAFEEHAQELRSITSSRRKFFGLDVSRWIAAGGLSVAAAMAHNVPLAVLAAAAPSVVGAPSIPDLQERWRGLQARSQQLQRSPTAILFRHLAPKFGFSSDTTR